MESQNSILRYLANRNVYEAKSVMGKNVRFIMSNYKMSLSDIKAESYFRIKESVINHWLKQVNDDYIEYVGIIHDMVLMKEGYITQIYNNDECIDIIKYVSTV